MTSEVSTGFILFIAAVAVAAVAGSAMTRVVGDLASEVRERGEGLASAIATDIAIVNDPLNVPYDSGADELTLYVKNTGSGVLYTEELSVLVDGVYSTFAASLLDGATTWTTGTVVDLTVDAVLSTGDHRARVVYTPNIADELDFRV